MFAINPIRFTVDIERPITITEPTVTQNNKVVFVIKVKKAGQQFILPDGMSFTLTSENSSGVYYTPTLGVKTGVDEITFTLGANELMVVGRVKATVQFINEDGRIDSLPFTYRVLDDITKSVDIDTNELSLIELVLYRAPLIIQGAIDATSYAREQGGILEGLIAEGIQGEQGIQGVKGDAGAQGIQGIQGIKGDKGDAGDGSPKGVYTTFATLQTAFPTGANGIYVVQADGKWYYWNSTAWVSGGVYQSVSLTSKAITAAMRTDVGEFGMLAGYSVPNFNLVTNRLMVKRPVKLIHKKVAYTLDDGTSDLSVDITLSGDYVGVLYYNTTSSTFKVKNTWTAVDENDVLIAIILNHPTGSNVQMAGSYTINGLSPLPSNTVTEDKIVDGSISWAKLNANVTRQYSDDVIYYSGKVVAKTVSGTITISFEDVSDKRLFYYTRLGNLSILLTTLDYTLPHNYSLVLNKTTKSLEIIITDTLIRGTHLHLLSNHNGLLKKTNLRVEETILSNVPLPSSPRTPKQIYNFSFPVDQDGCVVGDEVWMAMASNESHTTYSDIWRLNKTSLTQVGSLKHNLGHANGVDFKNDVLLVYNGGTYPPEINLYKSPVGLTQLNVSDANNTKIIFKEGAKVLEGDGSACFGENYRIVYYSQGTKVYKILLGTGDNNLSDTSTNKDDMTRWGTFISGKPLTEYNGTAKVIGIYVGYVGFEGQPQGMTYDGFLYLATGYNFCHAFKIQLKDDMTFQVVDDYRYNHVDYKNGTIKIEPESVFIIDNHIFVGARNGIDSFIVKFPL